MASHGRHGVSAILLGSETVKVLTLSAGGLGAYIAHMTEAGDYPRIALGVAAMSVLVIATNRLLWRPLYACAERRTRLD
jgi:NitT/TauT family transport system permease protein